MNQDIYVLIEHLQGQVLDISYMMLAQSHALTAQTGGRVVAVLLGSDSSGLANHLAADEVLYIDHPTLQFFSSETTISICAEILSKNQPRLMLFGETSIGSESAAGLSGRLGLPLVSACHSIDLIGTGLQYHSYICGGKLVAEGELNESQTHLVSILPGAFKAELGKSALPPKITQLPAPDLKNLRVNVKKIIEPAKGDVDITRQAFLISVGRGIQQKENIELAQELATSANGTLTGSRPIIDQGWLSSSRLVGKSGKSVKPRIYLALGISGAPEHVEAITGSEMIIAINTNPTAPIFNIAKYGASVDVLDLLPALTECVNQEKGG